MKLEFLFLIPRKLIQAKFNLNPLFIEAFKHNTVLKFEQMCVLTMPLSVTECDKTSDTRVKLKKLQRI